MGSLNRWWIAVAGVCLQMALGAGYAWSVFRIPLVNANKEYGWSIAEVSVDIYDLLVLPRMHLGSGRTVDEQERPQSGCDVRGSAVGRRRIFGELFGTQSVVAVSYLWRNRRNWARDGLHRSHRGSGEMVSRTPRAHYWDCGGWFWRWISHRRAARPAGCCKPSG